MRINCIEGSQLPDNMRYLSRQDKLYMPRKKGYYLEGYTKEAISTCQRITTVIFSIILPFLLLSKVVRRHILKGKEVVLHFSKHPELEKIQDLANQELKIDTKQTNPFEIFKSTPLEEAYSMGLRNHYNYKLEKFTSSKNLNKKDAEHLTDLINSLPGKKAGLFLLGLLCNENIQDEKVKEKFWIFCLKLINEKIKDKNGSLEKSVKVFELHIFVCIAIAKFNKLDDFLEKIEEKAKRDFKISKPRYFDDFIKACEVYKRNQVHNKI